MEAESIFVRFYSKLRENVDPDEISGDLFATHVITKSEKAAVDIQMFTPQARMDKLLAAVQRAININAQNFETFLDVIGKEGRYPDLADEMRGNVNLVACDIIRGLAMLLLLEYCFE